MTARVAFRLALLAPIVAMGVLVLWQPTGGLGVRESVYDTSGPTPQLLSTKTTPGFDLQALAALPLVSHPFKVQWTGGWLIPHAGFYAVDLDGDGDLEMLVDGSVLQAQPLGQTSGRRVVWLEHGLRQIDLTYARALPTGVSPSLHVAYGPIGGRVGRLQPSSLYAPSPRKQSWQVVTSGVREWLGAAAWPVAVLVLAAGVVQGAVALTRRATAWIAPALARRWLSALTSVAVALVVMYGAVLRFDAITLIYGPVERPYWLRVVQEGREARSVLRPEGVTWSPNTEARRYISDPFTYIQYAKDMQSFYAAHRREPVFPLVTKISLWLLSQQDVAVSFASAAFGVLAILATFLLGAAAWSTPVGLFAALALAVETDVITWSVGGWRDDAFTCAVVWSTYAMVRVLRSPTTRTGLTLGIVAGLACLIRITSLSFVIPGLLYLWSALRQPWRTRVAPLACAVVTMVLVVGPFLYNCWRVYGDPLYSINVHADIYRAAEGQRGEHGAGAAEYLTAKLRAHPFETIDTVMTGMTQYPFANKWVGFEAWWPGLGRALSLLAMAGLLLCVASAAGRLVLLMLVTSLVPYAFTWNVLGDWRFTEHAYPFFLLAAGLAVTRLLQWLRGVSGYARLLASPRALVASRIIRHRTVAVAATAMCVALGVWATTRLLPPLIVQESLLAHQDVTVGAGLRDGAFFVDGWSPLLTEGNVVTRVARRATASMDLSLPTVDDYDLTVRVDPFPRPLGAQPRDAGVLQIFANEQLVTTAPLTWNPVRVGNYPVHLPRALVHAGANRLRFALRPTVAGPGLLNRPDTSSFRLWYVRLRPTG